MKTLGTRFDLAVVAGLLITLLTVSGASAVGESNAAKLEGSWSGTVTAINPPLGSFANLITFIPGGGVIESRRLYVPETPFGPLLETPGHGEWSKVGERTFQVNFMFLMQGAPDNPYSPGAPIGTDHISLQLSLNPSGTELTGTFESEIRDLAGNVIFAASGTYAATPILAGR